MVYIFDLAVIRPAGSLYYLQMARLRTLKNLEDIDCKSTISEKILIAVKVLRALFSPVAAAGRFKPQKCSPVDEKSKDIVLFACRIRYRYDKLILILRLVFLSDDFESAYIVLVNWTNITHIMPGAIYLLKNKHLEIIRSTSSKQATNYSSDTERDIALTAPEQSSANKNPINNSNHEQRLITSKMRSIQPTQYIYQSIKNNDDNLSDAKRGTLQCLPIILLLGDSVDRHSVIDYCESEGIVARNWSHGLFQWTQYSLRGAAVCESSQGTIGHLHLFGSNATGPYGTDQDMISNPADPYIDTKIRLVKGIELFSHEIGKPTLIVYQSLLWDIFWAVKSPTLSRLTREAQAELYRDMLTSRLKEIMLLKDKSTALFMRTTPRTRRQTHTTVVFNQVIREVSRDLKLKLVDYDKMVWGSNRSLARLPQLFRDPVHPNKEMTKMLVSTLIEMAKSMCANESKS